MHVRDRDTEVREYLGSDSRFQFNRVRPLRFSDEVGTWYPWYQGTMYYTVAMLCRLFIASIIYIKYDVYQYIPAT